MTNIDVDKLLEVLREKRDQHNRGCDDDTLVMYKDIAIVSALDAVIEAIVVSTEHE